MEDKMIKILIDRNEYIKKEIIKNDKKKNCLFIFDLKIISKIYIRIIKQIFPVD